MTDETQLPSASNAEKFADPTSPLHGEAGIPSVAHASGSTVSWKGVFAVGLLVFSLIAVAAAALNRAVSGHKQDGAEARRAGEQPMAASNEPRRLDMALPAVGPASSPIKPIPAIIPLTDEANAAPIGVRRTAPTTSQPGTPQRIAPEDAPVLLVSSRPVPRAPTPSGTVRSTAAAFDESDPSEQVDPLQTTKRNLEGYQRQLQGLLETLNRQAAAPEAPVTPAPLAGEPVAPSLSKGEAGGLFAQQSTTTPRVAAGRLHQRSLTLPKGTSFTCALRTRIISATSGMVGCQVQRNVYGDDGRVLLIERGSHMDGEYRVTSVRPGSIRIPVLWTRLRMPTGVTVDVESPATGALGEAGIDGFVDNRWGERIGAALLLSLINDAVQLTIQNQANDRQADSVILESTSSESSKLAENVLDSTINIPPLIYQNQGGIVGIYVARDVDFSTVYELKATPR